MALKIVYAKLKKALLHAYVHHRVLDVPVTKLLFDVKDILGFVVERRLPYRECLHRNSEVTPTASPCGAESSNRKFHRVIPTQGRDGLDTQCLLLNAAQEMREMVWKKAMKYPDFIAFTLKLGENLDIGTVSRFNRIHRLSYEDPLMLFSTLYQSFNDKFPKHFIFANFQCLRCGECCTWGDRPVYRDDIHRWISEGRYDILGFVECREYIGVKCARLFLHYEFEPCENCDGGTIYPIDGGRCPFLRKVRNKPYRKCRIHETAPKECTEYICNKSETIAHLEWDGVDELIQKIGITEWRKLTKACASA